MGRAAALLVLATAVGVYYGAVTRLPAPDLWWEIAWLGLVVIPAVCALVGLALPLWRTRVPLLVAVGLGCAGLAWLLGSAGQHTLANFAKLGAMTALAWAFLSFFEDVSWVVLVALIIPWVDAYSVWRGPTKTITEKHENVFSALSFGFPLPDGMTHLGLPDLFFYALFLAAAARFHLRVAATWIALSVSFGGTLALAVWLGLHGLPALPLLSLGFLAPNADLLWRRLRPRAGSGPGPTAERNEQAVSPSGSESETRPERAVER